MTLKPDEISLLNAVQTGTLRGPPGEMGERGKPGPEGPRGPLGPLGPKGERGPLGLRGERGEPGESGTAGRDGIGPDEHVAIAADDSTPGFLADKLKPGVNITFRRRRVDKGDELVIDSWSSGASVGGGGGGDFSELFLALQAALDAHIDTPAHVGVPVYIQDTEPTAEGTWLWVDTNTDFLWYQDGQVS